MIEHCKRWLLPAAALYLALMPTNAFNFWRSLSFTVAGIGAAVLVIAALTRRTQRIPGPGWLGILLAAYAAWGFASLAWSANPHYTLDQLRRELLWSAVAIVAFYVAARDLAAWRRLIVWLLASFALAATSALVLMASPWGWSPGRWHVGVGPYATYLVLVAPFLVLLVVPPPLGFARGRRSAALLAFLLVVLLITARETDNRMVWVALATVCVMCAALGLLRWPKAVLAAPKRWVVPLIVMLLAIGTLFADAAREKATTFFSPGTTIAETLEEDPRIALWEHAVSHIRERPWTGYGFGRAILAPELTEELNDPLLSHAHNIFVSQWLQTGAVGLALFVAVLGALVGRYASFYRSRDDTLAVVGLLGLALIAGFVIKNLTDDFLFRSNAKEFWALNAMLVGFGMRARGTLAASAPIAVAERAAEAGR